MKIEEGKLITKVKLIGKRFILEDALIDTGSAFTVIPPQIADFLELEIFKKHPKAVLVTASGLIKPEVKILKGLEVGDIEIKKLPVVIHEIPDPAPVKVLLGMNFIKEVNLSINGKEDDFDIKDP